MTTSYKRGVTDSNPVAEQLDGFLARRNRLISPTPAYPVLQQVADA
jgi:hypothetical protein